NKPFNKSGNRFDNSERKFQRPFNKSGNRFENKGQNKFGDNKFNRADRPVGHGFSKYKSKDSGYSSDYSRDKFKPKHEGFRSDFGHDKFKAKKEGYRSDFGHDKFKHNKPGFPSDSGHNKFQPKRENHGGFDPLEYFSNRPETRIMTDKERFRASLRDNDRPSFGRGKNRPAKGRFNNRFQRKTYK
ncbi:MAG TPA: hypothetical protein VMC41_00405, partial [Candidatus Nanoarchaeia archaeon]|nr:hypothetical protein [Candidatus Nanoarchaeia archaeon]